MISSADFVFWIYATVLSIFVAFVIIVRGQFRRFSLLAMYFVIVSAVSLLRLHVFNRYGFTSREYGYFYYYSDLLLSVALYFVIASLYRKVFPSGKSHLHVLRGSVMIPAGVGIFSFAIVQEFSSRLLTHWILEYGQDLYIVSALAALFLFGAATRKPNTPKLVRQLTFVFAGYYLFFAMMYMIRNLSPHWNSLGKFVAFFGMWLPLGVAYVFCDPSINKSLDDPYPPL